MGYESYDYEDLIKDLSSENDLTLLFSSCTGGYTGVYFFVFRDNLCGKYYFINVSYGSCCICDQLEAITFGADDDEGVAKELRDLRNRLFNAALIFDSKQDLCKYVDEHDWDGDCISFEDGGRASLNRLKKFVRKEE